MENPGKPCKAAAMSLASSKFANGLSELIICSCEPSDDEQKEL